MSIITETIDNDVELSEAFERLSAFINSNSFTNKDVKRYNKILKNLTKQVWTKFYLYKKRHQAIANNKGMSVVPMDKKFIEGFMVQLKTDDEVKKIVYDSVSRDIRKLEAIYKGVRTGRTSKQDVIDRSKSSNLQPMLVISNVINAIALETTLKYMDEMDSSLDMDSIDPRNKQKMLKSMGSMSKGFLSSAKEGMLKAASERSGKK